MQIPNWMKLRRSPDLIVEGVDNGDYLRRWWILPRNKWFNIYLHNFNNDDDRFLHDHPWWNMTLLLKGRYLEYVPDGSCKTRTAWGKGAFTIRQPEALHRIELPSGLNVWTLFITGPVVRQWGFVTNDGWVTHLEYKEQQDERDNLSTL